MRQALRFAALVLPVLGLAGAWGWTQVRSQQGTEWNVPVAASGPRASLRGRYVAFTYRWKLPQDVDIRAVRALCLEGTPPAPQSVRAVGPEDRACRSLARAEAMPGGNRFSGLQGGILYVPQERVPSLRQDIADPDLIPIVRIRVNASGAITPLAIKIGSTGHPLLGP